MKNRYTEGSGQPESDITSRILNEDFLLDSVDLPADIALAIVEDTSLPKELRAKPGAIATSPEAVFDLDAESTSELLEKMKGVDMDALHHHIKSLLPGNS